MLRYGVALLAATDGSNGQTGLPVSWILALVIGGTIVIAALLGLLVWAIPRPAPWERTHRDRP